MEFMSKFLLKFLWWCISHEPMIRNHLYFNHRYPIEFALFLIVRNPGSMPGVGLEIKIKVTFNLGQLFGLSFSGGVYLMNQSSETIHILTIGTL